jgi:hypothetical protein
LGVLSNERASVQIRTVMVRNEVRSRAGGSRSAKSWSLASARQWTAENPAAGQCNVTALLIYDLFGGALLKTPLPEGDHFYNRIGGCRYDCTDSQFSQPITYSDLVAARADAESGAIAAELTALRLAFERQAVFPLAASTILSTMNGTPNRTGRPLSQACKDLRVPMQVLPPLIAREALGRARLSRGWSSLSAFKLRGEASIPSVAASFRE